MYVCYIILWLFLFSELGRQAFEEKQKQQELFEKGFSLYQQFSAQGKLIKEQNKVIYIISIDM